jgi:RHS repeat-associated protein
VASGAYATANEYRFSTKPLDAADGLYYYGFRYYNPSTGRWLSRDPIGERGGRNLYGMVGNGPIDRWDLLGLKWRLEELLSSADLAKLNKVDSDIKAVEQAVAKAKIDMNKGIPVDPSVLNMIGDQTLRSLDALADLASKAGVPLMDVLDNAFPNGLDMLGDGEKIGKVTLGILCGRLRAMTDLCDAKAACEGPKGDYAKCDKIRGVKNKICAASGTF